MARSTGTPKTPGRKPRQITPRQARFVQEYLLDLNGTQAAIRAGYSAKSADRIAIELLRNPEVAREISERQARREERTQIKADTVLAELLRLARVDLAQAFNENGDLKPIHEIPEDVRRAIAGVEIEALFEGRGRDREQVGFVKKVRFWDKNRSLELLGKHLALFIDRSENVTVDLSALSDEQLAALEGGASLLEVARIGTSAP